MALQSIYLSNSKTLLYLLVEFLIMPGFPPQLRGKLEQAHSSGEMPLSRGL